MARDRRQHIHVIPTASRGPVEGHALRDGGQRAGAVRYLPPKQWNEVTAAYRPADLTAALPAMAVQGLLSLADTPVGSREAADWLDRLGSIPHSDR
jgi:hypothetical protein